MDNILKTTIRLRKDAEYNYDTVRNVFIPASGEVCLVNTINGEIRIKVGDGTSYYRELPFIDEPTIDRINSVITRGYYHNGQFYVDQTYTESYVPHVNKIYIDNLTYLIYCWDAERSMYCELQVPTATETRAGIVKLYNQMGSAVDGAMTQKSTTDEINKKFEVSAGEDETLIFT